MANVWAQFQSFGRTNRRCTATVFESGGVITHIITFNEGPSDMRMTLTDTAKSHMCHVPIGKTLLDKIGAAFNVSDTQVKVMC